MTDSKGSDSTEQPNKADTPASAKKTAAKTAKQPAKTNTTRSAANKKRTGAAQSTKQARTAASADKLPAEGAQQTDTAQAEANAATQKPSSDKPSPNKNSRGGGTRRSTSAKSAAKLRAADSLSGNSAELPDTGKQETPPSTEDNVLSPAIPVTPASEPGQTADAVSTLGPDSPQSDNTAAAPEAKRPRGRKSAGSSAQKQSASAKEATRVKSEKISSRTGSSPEKAKTDSAQQGEAATEIQQDAAQENKISSADAGTEKSGRSKRTPRTRTADKRIGARKGAPVKTDEIPAVDADSPRSGTSAETDTPLKSALQAPSASEPVPPPTAEGTQPDRAVSDKEPEPAGIPVAALVPPLAEQPETAEAGKPPVILETPAAKEPESQTQLEEDQNDEQQTAPASAEEGMVLPEQSLADFPSSFDDLSTEDAFADAEGEDEGADGETPARKRRSRGRRGRGRKKGTAQAAEQPVEESAENTDSPAPSENIFEDEDESPEDDNARETEAKSSSAEAKAARKKMFVSVLPDEQVEVIISEEGQVLEYYVEMLHQAKTKGNIYKGIIHNVDPNLQAAFVNYGAVKNGFLQIDEVHPEYYNVVHESEKGRKYPPIQKVLKPGQEVLVQVVKEPAGTKGAFLTTYLSIPGRYLVLTPGREQIGVSRKVENEKERARLRELLEGLTPGQGLGVIVRTVSMGASKTNLQRDLQFLKRTWKEVRAHGAADKAPCLIYQEQDLTARAIRDYLTENIGEVWVDDEHTAGEVAEIATALFPRKHNLVRMHKEDTGTSLFERFNLQRQLDQIHSREVSLPSGGRLVIDPTEALTAIDINSGRSGGKNNFEDMAYRTNMEAAKMIPLQLRLRDIGGQVVADFIEMRDKSHWREVEKTLRNGMKVDRARYDVGKIGPFGMLEIVRQRLGSSAISVSTEPCPCCNGSGIRRNMEWQSQKALRDILRALRVAQTQKQESVTYVADPELALQLLNHKRQRLLEMENTYGIAIQIAFKKGD